MSDAWPENLRSVPIGEMMVSDAPGDVLIAYGLGSCVAICAYDPVARVGGMLHALLPAPKTKRQNASKPTKFVNRGVPLFLDALLALGARRRRLTIYLCGGARMLTEPVFESPLNIGERNVEAARAALGALHIAVRGEAVGGDFGRTARLYIATGRLTVKSLRHGEQVLHQGRRYGQNSDR